jgi:AP-3 complex subunit beta
MSPRGLNGVGDTGMGGGVGKGKEKTLDDWLAEESGSEEETDSDDEDEEEETDEDESEYETESESGGEGDRLVK